MSSKGFPSKQRETGRLVISDHVTAQPVREQQIGLDVVSHGSVFEVGTDIVEAGSTTSIINLTAHSAQVGDVIRFTSGTLSDKEYKVLKITTNTVELGETLSVAPSAADTISLLRHRFPKVNADGTSIVSISPSPLLFTLDGADQEVVEDTITPANNAPLPVKLTGVTGDINITAGDLNVQTSHTGASSDSMRIGDGVEELAINASNEAQTRDDDANTALGSLLTELQLKADLSETQPVSIASSPLPTGAATEVTLASLLTELQGKADLGETQPVSAASLPLPTGASTEATLASLLTELQGKADLAETQPVSAASLPLPTGASTEATLAAQSAKLPATLGQKAKAASLAVTLSSDEDPISVVESAKTVTEFIRNDYSSTSATTGAYVQLIASTTSDVTKLRIFDSSGQTLKIALGAAASEVDLCLIPPGGVEEIEVTIPSGTRISIRAVSADADSGEISMNLIG